MDPTDQDIIRKLAEQFRSEWTEDAPPSIAAYLEQVVEAHKPALTEILVRLDVALRMGHGQTPEANDYLPLGPFAFSIALQDLEERFQKQTLPKTTAQKQTENTLATIMDLDAESWEESIRIEDSKDDSEIAENRLFDNRYLMIEQIGQGGMGSVWLADQIKPFRRRVAIKFIRKDVADSEKAILRFAAERQAIAMMQHPNIAKILEAGRTDSGGPYFVMEWVAGVPLDEYCDQNRLNLRERLKIMLPVCRAVQHAHQKGIIHRDLKPSNILVTEHDGVATPMVIDFGLAKALGAQGTFAGADGSTLVEVEKIAGTLHYMSPEQATRNSDVDTRTDVYSLGVVIYKLLTGETPHRRSVTDDIPLAEALEQIKASDPPKPSAKIQIEDTVSELSENLNISTQQLKAELEEDLDWIIMKSIRRDRNDRYQTANALTLEIERFLNNEEIEARPSTLKYRVQKFISRNRGLVAAVAGLATLLILGIAATTSASVWALTERDRAEREAKNSKRNEDEANQSKAMREVELLALQLKSSWSHWQLGNPDTAWHLLDQTESSCWESRFLRQEFESVTSDENLMAGHARDVATLAVSNNGRFVATGSSDHLVKLFNARTKKLLHRFIIKDEPISIKFTEDGRFLYCCDHGKRLYRFDMNTLELDQEFGPFEKRINDLTLITPTRLFVTFANPEANRSDNLDAEIGLISVNDGKVIWQQQVHKANIQAVCAHSDSKKVYTASLDGFIKEWDFKDDRLTFSKDFVGHLFGVNCLDVSFDGSTLISGGEDKTVRLWDVADGKTIRTMIHHRESVESVGFSNDAKLIASGSQDKTAAVWDRDGKLILECKGHYQTINDVGFSVSNKEIFTASDDNLVRVWNLDAKPSTLEVKCHEGFIWQADFSPDGRRVVTASEDGSIAFTDAVLGKKLASLTYGEQCTSIRYAPDGSYFVAGGKQGKIKLWSNETLEPIQEFDAHANVIWDLAFSKDGKKLVSAGEDGTAKVWNTSDWSLELTLEGHEGEVGSARFSPDGKWIVTASDDKTVRLWDSQQGQQVHKFEGHQASVWRAIFSPDGTTIASSGHDGEIVFWDTEKRDLIRSIKAHTNQVAGLTFSRDGKRLVSASDDKTIKTWDIKFGIELFVLIDAQESEAIHVSFSKDGSNMLTGNYAGWITIRKAARVSTLPERFLPETAVEYQTLGLVHLTQTPLEKQDFQFEYRRADKCCRFFPSFESLLVRGIAEYRLDRIQESIASLEEALRLRDINYTGNFDPVPKAEAYLCMALWRSGRQEEAQKIKAEFNQALQSWENDEFTQKLVEEVNRTCR